MVRPKREKTKKETDLHSSPKEGAIELSPGQFSVLANSGNSQVIAR